MFNSAVSMPAFKKIKSLYILYNNTVLLQFANIKIFKVAS